VTAERATQNDNVMRMDGEVAGRLADEGLA